MELKKITERVYYIPNSTNIGVVKVNEKSTVLIDSGLDDDIARKILKVLGENGLFVEAIVNTHSHPDHCGGNRYIKEKTGAIIYAPEIESTIIENPILMPTLLFSCANPPKDLQNKYLVAKNSCVDHLIKKDEKKLKFYEVEFELIPLPGHALNQIGIGVDGVLFCADSIFSEEVFEKYKIPFNVNISKTKETLEYLKNSSYSFYIPSHAEPRKSLSELIDINIAHMDAIEKQILDRLQERKTTEQILREVCSCFQIVIKNTQQYYLINTAVMAYLSFLYERGKLKTNIDDNFLFWERV